MAEAPFSLRRGLEVLSGAPDVFLCAADLSACDRHPHLWELLIDLAAEVALNRGRKAGDSIALRVRAPLPGPRAASEPPGARPVA
jgi:hypothetical protein